MDFKIPEIIIMIIIIFIIIIIYIFTFTFEPSFEFLPNTLSQRKFLVFMIFAACFCCYFSNHIDKTLLSFTKCIFFLYFISAIIAWNLVDVFLCPFIDHTQGSHYYWHGGSFKMPHNFQFLFPGLVFTYFIVFFD